MNPMRNYVRGNPVGQGAMWSLETGVVKDFDVLDISASGMLVESEAGFREGEELEVRLEITGILFEKNLRLKATVVKVGVFGDSEVYALKTTGLSPNDKIEIDEIISCLNTFYSSFSKGFVNEENLDSSITWLTHISGSGEDPEKK